MKVHKYNNEILVAASDADLIGKTFVDGKLTLQVSKIFYGEEIVTVEQLIEKLEIATIANLVGKEVISIAINEKFIKEEGIIRIAGIPHAQMVLIE
jgi:hypothetical protein